MTVQCHLQHGCGPSQSHVLVCYSTGKGAREAEGGGEGEQVSQQKQRQPGVPRPRNVQAHIIFRERQGNQG